MKIGIVGGGPAGLFYAYLMKRDDPAHAIRVVERDPENATYGWGVVFSDVALAFVRDIAPELYDSMTRNQEVLRRHGGRAPRACRSRSRTTSSTGWRGSTCCARCTSSARGSASRSSSSTRRAMSTSSPTAT